MAKIVRRKDLEEFSVLEFSAQCIRKF